MLTFNSWSRFKGHFVFQNLLKKSWIKIYVGQDADLDKIDRIYNTGAVRNGHVERTVLRLTVFMISTS
jgi:hypothetical protein